MAKLIQNELIKWFRRPSFYVMSLILIALAVVSVVFTLMMGSTMENAPDENANQASWKESLQQENEQLKMTMDADSHWEQRTYAINEYRIKNNLAPVQENTVWTYVDSTIGLSSIITLFVVIIAAGMIASEFSWGTIKLLMIRPIKRSKILLAKYLAVLVFMAIFYVILFITSFLVGAIAFGMDSSTELLYANGEIIALHPFMFITLKMLLSSLDVLLFATIAFMISSVFRNNSLAIGLSLFLLFTGTQITQLVSMKYEWAKFSPFANINFTAFIDGIPVVAGTSFWFSIVMFLVYFILLQVISFLTFVKRDIAA
ncbi:ABC transporter permease [Sutcliffiella deserti]|uniref:ABC transporter permease n=1 Tax=Sutcliffiella deserti TaxID=2875501 RepID=UPI001CBC848F|nr:ABC transporter permease subunit [Sutcliffiella deserti]